MPDDRLRLIALDTEDLDVVSALVQDAVLKLPDINWFPKERRFVMAMNRFAWEETAKSSGEHQRRRSALYLARAQRVRSTGIDLTAPGTVLNLLAVRFEPADAPSGEVVLDFAGGATIRVDVECLEAQLADLGPVWSTPRTPRHEAT